MKSFLIIPFICLSWLISAQSTGKVKFIITPDHSFYKINNQVYRFKETKELELPPGEHKVEFWSEKKEVHTDVITIESGKEITFRKVLTQENETFLAYQKKLKKYNSAKFIDYAGGVSLVSFTTFSTIFMFINNKYDEIEEYKASGEKLKLRYQNSALSLDEYTKLKTQFGIISDRHGQAVKQQNLKMGIGIPVVAISYGATIFYLLKVRKNNREKPVFKDQNPFLGLIKNARPDYNFNSGQIGFTSTINF